MWPAALTTAKHPFKSITGVAALRVMMLRDGGDLSRTRRLWVALDDPAGVEAHRTGGFERIGWILDDWDAARTNQAEVEQHMTDALDQLGLTQLVTSIQELSPVGAASILAETGGLTRFTSARHVINRVFGGDYPGTLAFRRSCAAGWRSPTAYAAVSVTQRAAS